MLDVLELLVLGPVTGSVPDELLIDVDVVGELVVLEVDVVDEVVVVTCVVVL